MGYKTVYHTGDVSMPTYFIMNWREAGFRLSLKPSDWRRRIFKKWMPYLTGDIVSLELVVESTFDTAKQCEYEWQLQDILPDRNFRVVDSGKGNFTSKPKGVTCIPLDTHLIFFEAEYHLIIVFKYQEQSTIREQKQTLLDFYAMSRDVYLSRWSMGLMSGFVGAIIGLVVGILLTRLN